MLGVYASAAAILIASLVLGRALLHVVGLSVHTWLGGVVGFAVLTIACPLLIRLPGRGVTLAVLLGLVTIGGMLYLWREDRGGRLLARRTPQANPAAGDPPGMTPPGEGRPQSTWALGVLVALIILLAASLPFAFNERNGVLGEGIYTNDQAAQLFWTDWLQDGVGPEPNAVRFGYPTGPQSVAATVAEATNTSLLDSFNGLLLAIPILTGLTALGVMGALSPPRRVIAASLTALPFLAASFLAQSAFKETAMALLVLAFAVTLRDLAFLNRNPDYGGGSHPRRALIVVLILLTVASVFVYSIPGLVWFALALPIWLVLELATGGLRIDLDAARAHDATPPPGADHRRSARARRRRVLGVAALRLRRQGRHGAGFGWPAELAGIPGGGARDLARGRLPGRAGRRHRCLPGRGPGAAGSGDRGVRRLPAPRLGAGRDGREHGHRLHRRPPVRLDLRRGEGAGGDVPPCGDGDSGGAVLAELGARRRPRAHGRRHA